MKKKLPFIFFLSLITIVFNISLIIDFAIKNYANDKDFMYLIFVLMFGSAQLIFLCHSIYKNNVTNGEKSIRKIANTILFINWLDLVFVFFAFIEGIHAEQNPFTNITVIISWIIITVVIISVKYVYFMK